MLGVLGPLIAPSLLVITIRHHLRKSTDIILTSSDDRVNCQCKRRLVVNLKMTLAKIFFDSSVF